MVATATKFSSSDRVSNSDLVVEFGGLFDIFNFVDIGVLLISIVVRYFGSGYLKLE